MSRKVRFEMETEERRRKAWQLRQGNLTEEQIGKILGVNKATICRDLKEAHELYYKEHVQEASEYTRQNIRRLETLLASCWERALQGDNKAIDQARRIIGDLRKMLGQDIVQQQDVKVTYDNLTPDQMRQELENILKKSRNDTK